MTHDALPCRSCGTIGIEVVLSLGRMPLANALLTPAQLDQPEPTYPLDLAFCPQCTLLQLTHSLAPDVLFREYIYFSSFSDTMVHHARTLTTRLLRTYHLNEASLVVELGSNDGYLLQHYREAGIPVLGIEPAANVARVAVRERAIPTRCGFFGMPLAEQLIEEGIRPDVIHAHNVLAHVADLNGFVQGIRLLLAPDGVAVVEVPYVKALLDRCEFDTIYHEHLFYYSLTALHNLFSRNDLTIEDVELLDIHGGSLRLFVKHRNRADIRHSVATVLREESKWNVARADTYFGFASRVIAVRQTLRDFLSELKHTRKRIVGYGAAAKGTVLANYVGIGTETIDFVVDRSPHKQGRFLPGTHLPVLPPNRLISEMPNYVFLFAWNLTEEILSQQAAYRQNGGHFIHPIPTPRVL